MDQCQCLTSSGHQCTREPSQKNGQDQRFCWQHQNCKKLLSLSSQEYLIEKQKIERQKAEKQKAEKQIAEKQKAEKQRIEKQIAEKQRVEKQKAEKQKVETKSEKHASLRLTTLSGPFEFIFFPNINGKRILLLGEGHSPTGWCDKNFCQNKDPECKVYDVNQWLGDLVKNAPECLDIFLESDVISPHDQSGGKPLRDFNWGIGAIEDEFKQCLTAKSEKKIHCYSNNLRFHYIDARILNKDTMSPLLKIIQDFEFLSGGTIDFYNKHKKTILSYLMGIDRSQEAYETFREYLFTLFADLPFNMTVILNLNDKYMSLYYKYIDKLLSKLSSSIDKDKFLNTLLDIYEKGRQSDAVLVIQMDVFFLLRLFITFDQKKLVRGPLGCRDSQYLEIKNAIVYGGGYHIDIYNDFFQLYFQVKPEIFIKQDASNKCINFDQPFDFFS